jgi:PPOX class probable FMN-dependent enzyme
MSTVEAPEAETPADAVIRTVEQLEALYGYPGETSLVKELDHIIPEYAAFIEASPFAALATSGPEGLDCSPRGDLPGFVRIENPRTLMMPDRRGNNRADSLKNIIRNPGVALLFLVPGSGTTLRVNGRAHISIDAALCASFAVEGKPARSVIVIAVDAVYFQCARAIRRSDLWNPEKHVDPKSLPTPGKILEITSRKSIDGEVYDREWPERAKASMW